VSQVISTSRDDTIGPSPPPPPVPPPVPLTASKVTVIVFVASSIDKTLKNLPSVFNIKLFG